MPSDSPAPVAGTSPFGATDPSELATLRAELDRLDDLLHDTLMRRAEVVGRVADLRVQGKVALRPGREAAILRRLVARHRGALPARTVVRMWRELLAGTTSMQTALSVALAAQDAGACAALAREQFGALTPLRMRGSPEDALAAVADGAATVAVLPASSPGAALAPWWRRLAGDGARLQVVGLLPFWSERPEGTPTAPAVVISADPPDPSGEDRSLLWLATLPPGALPDGFRLAGGGEGHAALLAVDGLVAADDPRLAGPRWPAPPIPVGGYAVPLAAGPAGLSGG